MTEPLVPAVVVGLCSHGLAVARALGRAGVPVHALEVNRELPGTATRYATVHWGKDINGAGLIEDLQALASHLASPKPPILFLTNDNMVRIVSREWERLAKIYSLSWADSREAVDNLILKETFQQYCSSVGARHPKTRVVRHVDELSSFEDSVTYPAIVKPSKPLSAFKVKAVMSLEELQSVCSTFTSEMPLVVQDLVEGSDQQIAFCNMFLSKGRVLAHFEGRKLRAVPPALGMATAVGQRADGALFAVTNDFFHRLQFTGPAALEVKYDDKGRGWLIEATVGRTEYLVSVCITGGVNLPLVEYCHQVGWPNPKTSISSSIWIDSERDPLVLSRIFLWWAKARFAPRIAVPYFTTDDLRPFVKACRRLLRDRWRRLQTRRNRASLTGHRRTSL